MIMSYRLADGRYARPHECDTHHVYWIEKHYRSSEERIFRNLGGHTLKLYIPAHKDLHANVEPPPKPSKQLRYQIAEYAHDVYDGDEYEAFYNIAHFVGDIANTSWSDEKAQEAFLLHDNLIRQSVYVEKGQVEAVYGK